MNELWMKRGISCDFDTTVCRIAYPKESINTTKLLQVTSKGTGYQEEPSSEGYDAHGHTSVARDFYHNSLIASSSRQSTLCGVVEFFSTEKVNQMTRRRRQMSRMEPVLYHLELMTDSAGVAYLFPPSNPKRNRVSSSLE
eukprot:scaffold24060_cov50-Attheya_sp.AAC.1